LPPTVQGILAARIDRQPSEHKKLLQTLSVIGRESSFDLLTQVASPSDTQLEQMLAELRGAEFIYEQPAAGRVEYVFKHALTQEVAYNSLLIERRKQLHEQAGQALESIFAGQVDDHLSQLAHHYSHSGNLDKAIEYLGRAGQQAMQRSAHADAVGNLSSAIELLQHLPESPERIQRELLLHLTFGPALMAIKGFIAPEVERAYTRARELCERLDNPPELFPVLFGLQTVYHLRGELRAAYELDQRLLSRAQGMHDPALLVFAHLALGNTSYSMGEWLVAREHLEMAISLYDRERHRPLALRYLGLDAGIGSLSYLALTLSQLGYPDQALRKSNEALALAQALSDPLGVALAEAFGGNLRQLRRDARATQEAAERLNALSAEHGFPFFLTWATTMRGCAIAEQGRNEEGIEKMREGLAALNRTTRPQYLCLLAKACIETGRLHDGQSALTETLALADEHELRSYEAEANRLMGDLLLKQNSNTAEAQGCFQRAIQIARKQSGRSWELRATMSLARLLRDTNRRDEARAMLAEIYNWFTEGFDTADLKEAKALLDQLSN
jgi:tetratricopeptide (TPR) repeat protein